MALESSEASTVVDSPRIVLLASRCALYALSNSVLLQVWRVNAIKLTPVKVKYINHKQEKIAKMR